MNLHETAQLLERLSDVFPNFRPRAGTPEAWQDILGDIPPELVQAAAKNCCQQDTAFSPNAPQIYAEAKRLHDAANPDPSKPPPQEMWALIIQHVRHYPSDNDGVFLEAYLEAARAISGIGGFHALRTMTSEDIHRNLQPRFIRFYTEELARSETRKAARQMALQVAAKTDERLSQERIAEAQRIEGAENA